MKHALIAPHGVDERSCSAQVLSEAIFAGPNFTACTVAQNIVKDWRETLHWCRAS